MHRPPRGRCLKHLVRLDVDDDTPVAEAPSSTSTSGSSASPPTPERRPHLRRADRDPPAAARSINVHGRAVVPWLGERHRHFGDNTGAMQADGGAGSPASLAGLQACATPSSRWTASPSTLMPVLALSLRDYDAGAMVDSTYIRAGLGEARLGRPRRTALRVRAGPAERAPARARRSPRPVPPRRPGAGQRQFLLPLGF